MGGNLLAFCSGIYDALSTFYKFLRPWVLSKDINRKYFGRFHIDSVPVHCGVALLADALSEWCNVVRAA
jgi:hypothetical protein